MGFIGLFYLFSKFETLILESVKFQNHIHTAKGVGVINYE
jgi:hypothetical protein